MIGFRNIAVHEYEKLDFDIVRAVITKHLTSLIQLADICSLYISVNITDEDLNHERHPSKSLGVRQTKPSVHHRSIAKSALWV